MFKTFLYNGIGFIVGLTVGLSAAVRVACPSELHINLLQQTVVRVLVPGVKSGTGWCAGKGKVVTNWHVIESKEGGTAVPEVMIIDYNGNESMGSIIGGDMLYDVALIQSPTACQENWLTLAEEDAEQGTPIYSMGNPLGMRYQFFRGYVAGTDDFSTTVGIFVAPGQSGSPVIDEEGGVVGMVWGMVSDYPGLGLLVPSSIIKQTIYKQE